MTINQVHHNKYAKNPEPKGNGKVRGEGEVMVSSASNNKNDKHHGIWQVGNVLQLQDDLKNKSY